jgi:hypothetical protein
MKTTRLSLSSTPAAAPPILAIDLGKFKSVACAFDPHSGECRFH